MAPIARPAASAPPGRQNRKSRPYRKHQQQEYERGKDQAEELPNGQELQVIEFISGEANAACDRRIERIPDEIMQFHGKPRRPCIARRWHLDMLTGAKHDAAEHPADGLREARSRVLSCWTCFGIAAVPRRRSAQLVRGQ